MAEKFSLADLLDGVSKLDTGVGKEQIEYIDIDDIRNDDNNFYSLSGIDRLIGSIELVGLQQPVRVRPYKDVYVIVSGHRRTEALRRLVAEGKEEFRSVPCIVERDEASPELQELRLIFANSDTRVLSSAELQKQAARVEELLYKLKEQGMEFPGRMRDHVAEACNISRTKLARLKAIDNNLAFELRYEYNSGKLNETCAYALSQASRENQLLVYNHLKAKNYLFESVIRDMLSRLSEMQKTDCPEDLREVKCSHSEKMIKRLFSSGYRGYTHCATGCCSGCSEFASCASVCPKMKDAAKLAKAERKELEAKQAAAAAKKDEPYISQIAALWRRFGEARKTAGLDAPEAKQAVPSYLNASEYEAYESGSAKITTGTYLPYAGIHRADVEKLCAAADALGCSLDYLLCRTDDPRMSGPDTGSDEIWFTGRPNKDGPVLAMFDAGGITDTIECEYDRFCKAFYYPEYLGGGEIKAPCIAWQPIEKEGNDDGE